MALFLFVKPIIPVFEYIVNYDFIVKKLCENKEKPELACNGKCHLAKELAKASESEKPISSNKKNVSHTKAEVLFCNEIEKANILFDFYFFLCLIFSKKYCNKSSINLEWFASMQYTFCKKN